MPRIGQKLVVLTGGWVGASNGNSTNSESAEVEVEAELGKNKLGLELCQAQVRLVFC